MGKKKVSYPIHKMGKNCGYDEYEDGSIEVARVYSQPFLDALLAEGAVDDLLQSVTQQCYKLLIPIRAAKWRFWDRIKEDCSLDTEKYEYSFDPEKKRLLRTEKSTQEEPPHDPI